MPFLIANRRYRFAKRTARRATRAARNPRVRRSKWLILNGSMSQGRIDQDGSSGLLKIRLMPVSNHIRATQAATDEEVLEVHLAGLVRRVTPANALDPHSLEGSVACETC